DEVIVLLGERRKQEATAAAWPYAKGNEHDALLHLFIVKVSRDFGHLRVGGDGAQGGRQVHQKAVHAGDVLRGNDHDGVKTNADVVVYDAETAVIILNSGQVNGLGRTVEQLVNGRCHIRRYLQAPRQIITGADGDDAQLGHRFAAAHQPVDHVADRAVAPGGHDHVVAVVGRLPGQLDGVAGPLR